MGLESFFNLSLAIQVALGAGYLSYVTAYAGYRHAHSGQDAVFITLCFAVVASLTFSALSDGAVVPSVLLSFSASLLSAIVWRIAGRSSWHWLMRVTGVHRDDGVHNAWSAVVQAGREVGQVSVHLSDGRVLYLSDRTQFAAAPWEGLYMGGDGSIIMIVEKERTTDGTIEYREDIHDSDWGTRMTFVPSNEIKRINIRMR